MHELSRADKGLQVSEYERPACNALLDVVPDGTSALFSVGTASSLGGLDRNLTITPHGVEFGVEIKYLHKLPRGSADHAVEGMGAFLPRPRVSGEQDSAWALHRRFVADSPDSCLPGDGPASKTFVASIDFIAWRSAVLASWRHRCFSSLGRKLFFSIFLQILVGFDKRLHHLQRFAQIP